MSNKSRDEETQKEIALLQQARRLEIGKLITLYEEQIKLNHERIEDLQESNKRRSVHIEELRKELKGCE